MGSPTHNKNMISDKSSPMVDSSKGEPRRLMRILEDAIAEIDSWPELDEWDGILAESQRCDGLYPEFADAEEIEKIIFRH